MSINETTLVKRWKNRMPRFFSRICWVSSMVSGTALAINTAVMAAGAAMPEWWNNAFPYLVGIPAGMAFVAKFTVNGGFENVSGNDEPVEIDYDIDVMSYVNDGKNHNTVLDKDDN